ncbi:DoxX family protein [Chitinophaga sedimenti]|uniref:DoxX family protein n=1 Tax=Chitinophaga sedimenti TaxID=2033606 RepID=UPI002003AA0A|nr:DoxX family protein [Chitinophaga sedimenti]MCK7556665.1 DoxX family protein [Chitinophaga sedimenti]
MKKLFSTAFSDNAVHFSMLGLRLVLGIFMILNHGWPKLMNFAHLAQRFSDPLGVGKSTSLGMAVFAEVFCSVFLILGLFTRLALIPLIILGAVIVFKIHIHDGSGKLELPVFYLVGYLVLMFCGPGRVSIDGLIGK